MLKKILFVVLAISMLVTGCASFGEKMATPETPEEKLAYAEATLTGLTIAAIHLNDSRLITLDQAKEAEELITKAEFLLRLGRIALNGKDADTSLEKLEALQEILLVLNRFVESSISNPLQPFPVEGSPVPIKEDVT